MRVGWARILNISDLNRRSASKCSGAREVRRTILSICAVSKLCKCFRMSWPVRMQTAKEGGLVPALSAFIKDDKEQKCQKTGQVTPEVTPEVMRIIQHLEGAMLRRDLQAAL